MTHPFLFPILSGVPVVALLAGPLLCHAALHDLAARTIPDRVTFAVVVLGGASAVARGTPVGSAVVAALVFVLLLLTWIAGMLGGGDVKLIPAVTLLVPPPEVPMLMATIAMAGGVVSIGYLVLRRFIVRNHSFVRVPRPATLFTRAARAELWRIRRHGPIPYAVAIAAGTLFECGIG